MTPAERTQHPFLKGVVLSVVAGLALTSCAYQNTAEMNAEGDVINRKLAEEIQQSNEAIPDYSQEKKTLFKDVAIKIRGENDDDWSRSFMGKVFNQLERSDTDSFRYVSRANDHPEWVWDNRASRSDKVLDDAALSVRYDEGTLHVKKTAQTKGGGELITTDVTIKAGHLHRTEPGYDAGRAKWSGWIKNNAGQLAMKKLHGEVYDLQGDQKVDTVDLWMNYRGNSTKPSAFVGFDSQGVQPVDPDVETKRAALDEFMDDWGRIKLRPAA